MEKVKKKDLDPEKYDMDAEYTLKTGHKFRLRDIEDEHIVLLKNDGGVALNTFNPLMPNMGGYRGGGKPKKMNRKTPVTQEVNMDDPDQLRNMFRQCFSAKEVNRLINTAKTVAIKNGNQKMIQFLLEQLFGKAAQSVTHSGDQKRPITTKKIDNMTQEELDEYLKNHLEGETSSSSSKKADPGK